MLGRGHLSMLRQGHGTWPARENVVITPAMGREDMILMDGQLERESLLEFCPKSRPQKYFSPPRRPWDFAKVCQPKRLWDFSPPFCKEVLQVNTLSTRRISTQDCQREQCCRSVDGMRRMNGFQNHLSPTHQSKGLIEDTGTAATMSQSVSQNQVNVRHVGFWPGENEAPSLDQPSWNNAQDLKQLSIPEQVDSCARIVTLTEQHSSALQMSTKGDVEIQEIESLKAQMALLCERVACYIARRSMGECKAGMANALDSEEYLLLKRIGELKTVVSGETASDDLPSKPGKEFNSECADVQEVEEVCHCRADAWKIGLSTLFQCVLWYIGLMMTIVRCTDGGLYLSPT